MKPFGLTGNIGCGKSTVAALLSKYPDVLVLDCDRIAKEVISGEAHRQEINTILSTNVFPDGKANFRAIAEIIFGQPEKKRLLEALVHPLVWATVHEKVVSVDTGTICIVESAILFETKSEDRFAAIIVAACDPHEQFRRLRENRKMDDAEIQARIAQQLPASEKERRAQFVIRTDCSLNQLKDRARDLYRNLRQQKGVQI